MNHGLEKDLIPWFEIIISFRFFRGEQMVQAMPIVIDLAPEATVSNCSQEVIVKIFLRKTPSFYPFVVEHLCDLCRPAAQGLKKQGEHIST